MEEDEFKAEFRVRRDDIHTLTDRFGFPENVKCYNRLLLGRLRFCVFV